MDKCINSHIHLHLCCVLCLTVTKNEAGRQGRNEQSKGHLWKEAEKTLAGRKASHKGLPALQEAVCLELPHETSWLGFLCVSKGGSSPWLVKVYVNEVFCVPQSENWHWSSLFCTEVGRVFNYKQQCLKITLHMCFSNLPSPSSSGLLRSCILYAFFPFVFSFLSRCPWSPY